MTMQDHPTNQINDKLEKQTRLETNGRKEKLMISFVILLFTLCKCKDCILPGSFVHGIFHT